MLSEWQKHVDQYIPQHLPGYDFVCRVPVYIPVQEIGLTVWERRVQSLSFIQECVLMAICIGAKSLPVLAGQFGLPETIMLQIVSQLDSEQLAAVSGGDIVLTDVGRQVLEKQQKVKILRSQLSRVFINQITGEISDVPFLGTHREPPRGQPYLQEVYPVTLDFLRGRFETLATIYRETRLANLVFQSAMVESAELYRILDISYQTLSYVREFCFVYRNQEDQSLDFRFQSGIQAYADALSEQINQHILGAWNLFSPPRRLCTADPKDELLPAGLIEAASLRGSQSERLSAIEEAYFNDRPLLDGETKDILRHCFSFKADRILIEAPYLDEFLHDDAVQAVFSPNTKEVIVRYSQKDFQAKRILDKLSKQAAGLKECKLTIVPLPDISSVKFYFGSVCAIEGQYAEKETVYRRHLYRLCARITFDPIRINTFWDNALFSHIF